MRGKKILIIDDDPQVRDIARLVFTNNGAEAYGGANAREGLRLLYSKQPDLVILDIMLPDQDGWETCRQIRQLSDVPVILLTALKQDEDIVRGLNSGADDFVSKPFSNSVLLARARAVLRRAKRSQPEPRSASYKDDWLSIDFEERRLLVDGKPARLTSTEFKLLAYMLQNAGRVLTFDQILENVWGKEYRDSVNYVHVYISHLRQKLEPDPREPRYLVTEHGVGYRFEQISGD